MAQKDAFLNSLSDEQLGIFYAHEYSDNLDDVLQDYITPIQYALFMEWRKNETVAPVDNAAATNNADSAKLDNLLSVVNNLTTMMVALNERMDSIESSVAMNQQDVIGKIVTLELNQKHQTEKLSLDISNLKQQLDENKEKIMKNIYTVELNQKNETDRLSLNLKQYIAETTEGIVKNQQDVIGKIATLELNQNNQTEKLSLEFASLKPSLLEKKDECKQFVTENNATMEQNQKNQTDKLSLDISNLKQQLDENRDQLIQNQQDLIEKITILELNQKKETEKLSLDISNLRQQLDENHKNVMKAALQPLEYKAEVKDNLKKMLSRLEDSSMTKEMKEEIFDKDIIKKILKEFQIFKDDEEIEKNSTEIIWKLSFVSLKVRINIFESGILENMKELFISYWPTRNNRESMLTNIFFVFYNISGYSSTDKYLMKDTFFELFVLPFADPNVSKFNIIAGKVLANLLFVEDKNWTVKMAKQQVDNLLLENIGKWQLGLFNPFFLTSFEWTLQQISKSDRQSLKLFYSWDVANTLSTEPAKYTELLKKDEQSVRKLEELVAKESSDAEVKKHLQICLDIIRKYYSFEENADQFGATILTAVPLMSTASGTQSAYLMMELSLFFSNSTPDRKPEESIDQNSTIKIGNSTASSYFDVTTAGYDKNKEDAAKHTTCLVACHGMHVLCAICIAIIILLYDLSLFAKKFPSLLNLILLVFTIIFNITGCVLLSSLAYWYEPTEENTDKTNENFSFAFYGLMLYSIFAILLTLAATTLKTFQILYKRSKRPPRPKEVATPISSTPIPITAHEPDPKDLNPDQAPPTDTMGTAVEMDKPKTEHTNVTSKMKSTQRDSKIGKSKMEKKSERSGSGRKKSEMKEKSGREEDKKEKNSSRKSEKSKSRKTEKEKEKTEEEKRKSRKDSEISRVKSDRSKDKKKDRNNNKATGNIREKGREKERKKRSRSDKDKKVKNEEKSKPGKGKSRRWPQEVFF